MELFNTNGVRNLLPKDGTVLYYGRVLDSLSAKNYYDSLLHTIEWKNDEAWIYRKLIVTKRKVAWYGNEQFDYTYSGVTKRALPWTKELLELKSLVEGLTNTQYNSCLLNLYHTGEEGMAWHSDDEKSLGRNTSIASISLGAERKFSFKHKLSGETTSIVLEHGSLLLMKDETQTHWLHRLPPTTKVKRPRVNLTFRTIVG